MTPDPGLGRPMRVLYVNHTSVVSGAELALLDLLAGFDAKLEPGVACPEGELAERVKALGIPVHPITGTSTSLKLSAKSLLRAVADLSGSARGISRAARSHRAEAVHANSIRAGLMAALLRRGRRPLIVHVHDVLPESTISRIVRRVLLRRATALVAISEYVKERFEDGHARGEKPFPVMFNPIDVSRFCPRDAAASRAALGLSDGVPIMSVIGQITPWKGQDFAVRVLGELHRSHPRARLLIAGEPRFVHAATRFDNRAFDSSLRSLISELRLDGFVDFLGHRDDTELIVSASNVVLVPSWEEPLGRTVLEGMAAAVPVMATCVGGPAETIVDGVTGYVLETREPEAWADVLRKIIDDEALAGRLGREGRARATHLYDRDGYARRMAELYASLVRRAGPGHLHQ